MFAALSQFVKRRGERIMSPIIHFLMVKPLMFTKKRNIHYPDSLEFLDHPHSREECGNNVSDQRHKRTFVQFSRVYSFVILSMLKCGTRRRS